jgi:hypothetical protein
MADKQFYDKKLAKVHLAQQIMSSIEVIEVLTEDICFTINDALDTYAQLLEEWGQEEIDHQNDMDDLCNTDEENT